MFLSLFYETNLGMKKWKSEDIEEKNHHIMFCIENSSNECRKKKLKHSFTFK